MTKISKFKRLSFLRPDGITVDLDIPDALDQSAVKHIAFHEYSVKTLITSREIAESEYSVINSEKGEAVGFLIPGEAILSEENPNNSNKFYSAYSLIVASIVCRNSFCKDYTLSHHECASATDRSLVFAQNCYYLVLWNSKIPDHEDFEKRYSIFLGSKGLVWGPRQISPLALPAPYESGNKKLTLKATSNIPDYILTILVDLVPFTENPFLRFFYLYQIIEYLMAQDFDSRVGALKSKFTTATSHSITDLKDILKEFQKAIKEDSRINSILMPECPITQSSAEAILDSLNIDHKEMSFADKIYKIRNTLFHDYQRIHGRDAQMSILCRDLFEYLIGRKMLG